MTNPKISIIVPVYNAERYLRRCVDSILCQDFSGFELILVDDGSKDKSGEICDEYAAKDARVRTLHEQWEGVSSARNIGLDYANGEWVTFVDSDDYVSPNYFASLTSHESADLIVGQCRHFTQDGKLWIAESLPVQCFQCEEQVGAFLAKYLNALIMRTPWGKFFRRELIAGNRFDKTLRIGEDTVFVHQYLLGCKSITVVASTVYNYLIGGPQSAKYSMSPEDALYHIKRLVSQYRKLNVKCLNFENFIFGFMLSLCVDNMKSNIWFRDEFMVALIKSFRPVLPVWIYWKYKLMRCPLFFRIFIERYQTTK